jgi:hypothetical protein
MSQIILYQSEDGRNKLDVRLEGQTVWLSQKQLTELFGKAKGTISEHIKHIFEDGELEEDSVVRLYRTTAADGKTYEVTHYNLDMVLALGFRVRSQMALRFRQWAADKLKEYIWLQTNWNARRTHIKSDINCGSRVIELTSKRCNTLHEVANHVVTRSSENAFRMELHSLNIKFAMTYTHDHS